VLFADVNECLTDNGGCDPMTACTNTMGSRKCGACCHAPACLLSAVTHHAIVLVCLNHPPARMLQSSVLTSVVVLAGVCPFRLMAGGSPTGYSGNGETGCLGESDWRVGSARDAAPPFAPLAWSIGLFALGLF
jgi:hypothetical protein